LTARLGFELYLLAIASTLKVETVDPPTPLYKSAKGQRFIHNRQGFYKYKSLIERPSDRWQDKTETVDRIMRFKITDET
jgi:hypothetical protein